MADNGEDNDDNGDQLGGKGTPVMSPEITLAVGDEPTDDGDGADGDLSVDFGFYMPVGVSLGDSVWHDEDNDGVKDPEEDGIEGVTVELYEAGADPASDDPIATDVTISQNHLQTSRPAAMIQTWLTMAKMMMTTGTSQVAKVHLSPVQRLL